MGRFPGACAQVPHRFKGVTVTDQRFVARANQAGLQVQFQELEARYQAIRRASWVNPLVLVPALWRRLLR